MLTPSVKHFVFNPDPSFDYTPGQFITIHIQKEDKVLRRSYSIANPPREDKRIEFAAGFVEGGPGTALLFGLKPGDVIQTTTGPFGRLLLKPEADEPKRYILVATSTGITPYRAMIPALTDRLIANPTLEVVLLQGVQRQEDLLYHDDFLNFAKANQNVTYRAQFSREKEENLRAHEYIGYVQNAYDALNLNPDEDMVYLCGNPGMVDASFSKLKDLDFSIKHIIREKYISR